MKLNLLASALLSGAVTCVVAGYAGKPDAQTCQVINNVATQLGNPATCSSSPVAWLMWLALALVLGAAFLFGMSRFLRAGAA